MSNDDQITLTLIPHSIVNSTTVTLSQTTTTSNSFSNSMQFAQNIQKSGSVVDDAGRLIMASAITSISIA